jgi:predicted amidohydrolase
MIACPQQPKKGHLVKVAAIQLQSKLDPVENLAAIRRHLGSARDAGVKVVFLPEVFYSISDGTVATPHLVQDGNAHWKEIQRLAIDFGVYLLGGSVATSVNGKILNRSYNFAPDGTELGRYDKMHLFACDLSKHPSATVINEGTIYTAGATPLMLDVEGWQFGISICFDLRFPELFRWYSSRGAEALSISSAFTVPTGKAHWHTLVRARAIENQCYVVACGQWGEHNERIKTYGHSLIVDPWGEVLQDAGEGEGMITAEFDRARLTQVRERLDVLRDPSNAPWMS